MLPLLMISILLQEAWVSKALLQGDLDLDQDQDLHLDLI